MSQALDAVVTWRAGDLDLATSAEVRWWVDPSLAHITWEEQGAAADSCRSDDRHVWTLPLLARVVQAHDGSIDIKNEDGWRVHLYWPASASST